jgi:hypothetical protein
MTNYGQEDSKINELQNRITALQKELDSLKQDDQHKELKELYYKDNETCKSIDGLNAWQLWQVKNKNEWIDIKDIGLFKKGVDYRRHPHADSMILFHKNTDAKWQWFYKCNTSGVQEWVDCKEPPKFKEEVLYRIKPDTITINNKEYPAPLRIAPEQGSYYYFMDVSNNEVDKNKWHGTGTFDFDYKYLGLGVCFATQEDAQAVLDAILEILRGKNE